MTFVAPILAVIYLLFIVKDIVVQLLSFFQNLGYIGVFLIMAIESTAFPIIIPSEFFLISYGIMSYHGEMSFFLVLFFAVIGILIGSLVNYYIAMFLGRGFLYKYGKYFLLKKEKLREWEVVFIKYSKVFIFVGRFIPIPSVKHVVSIPAGLSKMNIGVFSLFTTLGGLIFSFIVLSIGYFYGHKVGVNIEDYINVINNTILVLLLFAIIAYFIKKKLTKNTSITT